MQRKSNTCGCKWLSLEWVTHTHTFSDSEKAAFSWQDSRNPWCICGAWTEQQQSTSKIREVPPFSGLSIGIVTMTGNWEGFLWIPLFLHLKKILTAPQKLLKPGAKNKKTVGSTFINWSSTQTFGSENLSTPQFQGIHKGPRKWTNQSENEDSLNDDKPLDGMEQLHSIC